MKCLWLQHDCYVLSNILTNFKFDVGSPLIILCVVSSSKWCSYKVSDVVVTLNEFMVLRNTEIQFLVISALSMF